MSERGALVVVGEDELVVLAVQRIAVRAVLAHADAVAVPVATDEERACSIGHRCTRQRRRHADCEKPQPHYPLYTPLGGQRCGWSRRGRGCGYMCGCHGGAQGVRSFRGVLGGGGCTVCVLVSGIGDGRSE